MATTPYDQWQTTFFLSNLANAVSDIAIPVTFPLAANSTAVGDAQIILADMLASKVSNGLGLAQASGLMASDWTVTWGPAVYVEGADLAGSYLAANAAYVAFSPSLGRYVLAIAATDPLSSFDWVNEDFQIIPAFGYYTAMCYWNGSLAQLPTLGDGLAAAPSLTKATVLGVMNVLSLVDPASQTTLLSYLQNKLKPTSGQTLTVTGHSLGGALSPTLALALVAKASKFASSSTAGPLTGLGASQVQVYATAGATPGNAAFASLFGTTFKPVSGGSQPWQTWNAVVYNTYDLVPNAWVPATLTTIQSNYDSAYAGAVGIGDFNDVMGSVIKAAGDWTALYGSWGPLRASFNTGFGPGGSWANSLAYDAAIPGVNAVLTMTQAQIAAYNAANSQQIANPQVLPWLEQIGFQHTHAYGETILGAPVQSAGSL